MTSLWIIKKKYFVIGIKTVDERKDLKIRKSIRLSGKEFSILVQPTNFKW